MIMKTASRRRGVAKTEDHVDGVTVTWRRADAIDATSSSEIQGKRTLSQTRKHEWNFPIHPRVESTRQHLPDLMFFDVRQLVDRSSFIGFGREMQGRVPVVVSRVYISLATIHESDADVRVAPLRGQVQWPST